jgi:hypothetical protein
VQNFRGIFAGCMAGFSAHERRLTDDARVTARTGGWVYTDGVWLCFVRIRPSFRLSVPRVQVRLYMPVRRLAFHLLPSFLGASTLSLSSLVSRPEQSTTRLFPQSIVVELALKARTNHRLCTRKKKKVHCLFEWPSSSSIVFSLSSKKLCGVTSDIS